ncbi:MAG: LTA synthase family protein [Clostridiales bacterium]|nr:LTA synthase family protein [Clostridiales bacterium]
MKNYLINFYTSYGLLGVAATVAVIIKMALFYFFIGSITNVVAVFAVSCILLYLLFSSFQNKWIPAGIFAAFSILLFCDVMYSSFFNRYLSVNMLGAVSMLGDITASIAEVFRASFLLLFVDVILVFACLIKRRFNVKNENMMAKQNIEEDEFWATFEEDLATVAEADASAAPDSLLVGRTKGRSISKAAKNPVLKWVLSHTKQLAAGFIILLLIVNVTGSAFITSIANQEIITYRFKDIANRVFATEQDTGLLAFRDTYRHEIDGPFFGAAEGRNLIVIQIESLQNFVIGLEYNGQEVTPVLNRLIAEENTTYFDNFFQQVASGNTSDAEFTANHAILGSIMSYTNRLYGSRNYFRGLPAMLREKGYDTAVFHAFERKNFWHRDTTFPNWGFNRFFGGLNDRPGDGVFTMTEWMGWGLVDTHFYEQTLDFMEELSEPFYSFVISLSNHHPYEMLEHYRFFELLPEDEGTMVGNYLQSVAFTDYALGLFLDGLKERGWYDNSLIVIFADHLGLTRSPEIDESMERLLGRSYDFDVMLNLPFIVTLPNSDVDIRQTISVAGGQIDVFPTIAYLMGFPRLDTLYLGHNLYAITEGLVAQQTHMTRGSFFMNDIAFEMSRDGVFQHGRAWNFRTGESVPLDDVYEHFIRSMQIINTSEYILRSDAVRRIFLDGENIRHAFDVDVARTHPPEIVIAGAPGEPANTIKAIQYSHRHDYRFIRVEMGWTERINDNDPYPIVINDAGDVLMTHHELIQWMQAHANTNIIVSIERSGDFFMRVMTEHSPAIADRLILELPQLYEYTGRHDAILNLSNVSQSAAEIRAFVDINHVWAIMMTQEESEGRFAELMDIGTVIYIVSETDGTIVRAN